MTPTEAIELAAKLVGGKAALAGSLKVSPPTVSQWSSGSRPVPAERALQIEELTKGRVRREVLCPTFPWKVAASCRAPTPDQDSLDRRAAHDLAERRGRRETDPTGTDLKILHDCAEQALAVAGRLVG